MLFNSIDFALFLPVVFAVYWLLQRIGPRTQNIWILFASYVFYGWWDWRFLLLIFFSTGIDYVVGLRIKPDLPLAQRKRWLWLSVAANLGMLGFFKYFNFFAGNFVAAFTFFGAPIHAPSLNVILPVGISFYTFQTMSYTIDIYRGKLVPTRDFIAFAAFVSFFPQLVAGPIERASNLLPQMLKKRVFSRDQALQGTRFLLWGLFRKIVIADAVAPAVDIIFANHADYSSAVLLLGAVLFSFQVYADFSGYSLMARGISKLLGFELMVNFNFPYFSRNFGEFWRRWHISLTTWIRDYLYIPLGGSREGKPKAIRNIFIIFLASGFWHGANWTYVVWGGIHAILFIPSYIRGTNRKNLDPLPKTRFVLPTLMDSWHILRTFFLVTLASVVFRSESVSHAYAFITELFSFRGSGLALVNPYDHQSLTQEYLFIVVFMILEYLHTTRWINLFQVRNTFLSHLFDALLIISIIVSTHLDSQLSFIYFQF